MKLWGIDCWKLEELVLNSHFLADLWCFGIHVSPMLSCSPEFNIGFTMPLSAVKGNKEPVVQLRLGRLSVREVGKMMIHRHVGEAQDKC